MPKAIALMQSSRQEEVGNLWHMALLARVCQIAVSQYLNAITILDYTHYFGLYFATLF